MEIFQASHEWANRPNDQRFWTVKEAYEATLAYMAQAVEAEVSYSDLRVEADGEELLLSGREGHNARISNWAFGQLVERSKPQGIRASGIANYLAALPATTSAQVLNSAIKRHGNGKKAQLLFHVDGNGSLLRAITGEVYSRYWNAQFLSRAMDLQTDGWLVPPAYAVRGDERARPATAEELAPFGGATTIRPGDIIGPAGIYASNHDLFLFLTLPGRSIGLRDADGGERVLNRFAMFWNGELGEKSLGMMTGLHDTTCGNHIIWGARGVHEVRVSHVGNSPERFYPKVKAELRAYADESMVDDEAKLRRSQTARIGATREDVVDALFKAAVASRRDLEAAYDLCEQHRDGDPLTYWGMTSGLTRLSQGGFADKRVTADKAAGEVLRMAF